MSRKGFNVNGMQQDKKLLQVSYNLLLSLYQAKIDFPAMQKESGALGKQCMNFSIGKLIESKIDLEAAAVLITVEKIP